MRSFPRTVSCVLSLAVGLASSAWAAPAPAPAGSSRFDWFNKAKFGLFIHWGLYAVPAGAWGTETSHGEWIMMQAGIPSREYEKLAAQFNPVKFDAAEWVGLAKDAGMNYLVITAKHHDGFCMYDSKLTDYDIVDATPFKRDPVKELSEASRKAGVKFCAYYSIVDWHHPDFPQRYAQIRRPWPDGFHGDPRPDADIKKYADYQKGQVRELLTKYGDVGILWFDGGGSFRNRDRKALLDGQSLVDMIHELQPGTLINNRLGFGGDYGTPEQSIPDGPQPGPFEVCMTLNGHWGYNKNDSNWKSSNEILRNLVDIASKGGNYLLNVGPTAEGVIPPESVRILHEVGQWLKVNGESIYETTAGPSGENVRATASAKVDPAVKVRGPRMTRKPGKLFVTLLDWPTDQKVFMEGMKGKLVTRAYLLADPARKPLALDAHERSLFIELPKAAPDANPAVIVLELKGDEPLEDSVGTQAAPLG
jgi:alpha-L-fucosidase